MKTEGNAEDFAPVRAPSIHDDAPDWTVIQESFACPLCGYSLRGLVDSRCPECGYQFIWADVLDPARQRHPYLFEANSESKFSSFWKTAFHSLRPNNFWKSVRATHSFNHRLLISYSILVSAVILIGAISQVIGMAVADDLLRARPPWMAIEIAYIWLKLDLASFVIPPAIILIWPWLSLLALHLLRISMRRAKISTLHVLRCVIYSWDVAFWVGLLMIVGNFLYAVFLIGDYNVAGKMALRNVRMRPAIPCAIWFIVLPIFVYRLTVAYRRYLTFRNSVSIIFLTQTIVSLVTLALVGYGVWIFGSELFDYRLIRIRF